MAYSERHRWCTSKIQETFAPELEIETIQSFIRNEIILTQFNQFFKGEGSGRIFVFYQPAITDPEVSLKISFFLVILISYIYSYLLPNNI